MYKVIADAIVSSAPLVAIMCPVMDLFAVTGMACARAPSVCLMARVSAMSFLGVPVPCALTQSIFGRR